MTRKHPGRRHTLQARALQCFDAGINFIGPVPEDTSTATLMEKLLHSKLIIGKQDNSVQLKCIYDLGSRVNMGQNRYYDYIRQL